MGFRAYADGKLVADTGLLSPGDGTRVIDVDTRRARKLVLESVDWGYWLGTPQLLALWQDVRFECDEKATVEEDSSGTETPQFGILTPPMGWSAWNAWRCAISDKIVRDTAAAFVEKGLADHGWT